MKKTLFLLLILSAAAFGQTAPNAYTTNYRIRQWASGANPGADSLNANWALIDSSIRRPRYTIQDSIISTGNAITLGSADGTDVLTFPAKITSFVGNITEGTFGVPAVVDVIALTSQQSDATNVDLTSTTATGDYRISMYLNCDAVVAGTDSLYGKITWRTSGGNSVSDSTSQITMTATSVYTSKTFFVRHVGAGATAIKYSIVGGFGGGDGHARHVIVERLN